MKRKSEENKKKLEKYKSKLIVGLKKKRRTYQNCNKDYIQKQETGRGWSL